MEKFITKDPAAQNISEKIHLFWSIKKTSMEMSCLELIKCKAFWKSANFLKETSMQYANYIFLWLISVGPCELMHLRNKETSKGLIKLSFKL